MRKEFVYSFLALGAIPVTVNATDVTAFSKDAISSPTGAQISEKIGKLAPGKYTLKGEITTKLYEVTIKIGGAEGKAAAFKNGDPISIPFTLEKETDVELVMVSTSPGVSGAEFALAEAVVNIDVDFATAKSALKTKAEAVKTKIQGTDYPKQAADVKTVDAIIKEIDDIEETYDDYAKYGLNDTDGGAEAKKISALENLVVFEQVNEAIATVKAAYNAAVADLGEELVDAAAYLLPAAQKELDAINEEITKASVANNASKEAGTAAADEATNTGLIPEVKDVTDIVDDYKAQSKDNKDAYKALDDEVKGLQKTVDNQKVTNAADVKDKKEAAQKAIDAVKALVDKAYNTKDQLTLSTSEAYTKALAEANAKIGEYQTTANNSNAYEANAEAIGKLQSAFDKAKSDASAKKSKDGKYSANGAYYTDYLKGIQDEIDALTKANDDAKKANTSATIDTETIAKKIETFLAEASAAVDYYDKLQDAMASYNTQLETARAEVENMDIYDDEVYSGGKNYKYELDALLKEINDIQGAIDDAIKNEKGEDHWKAIQGIDKKGDTTFASVEELDGQKFAIINLADGKAIFGKKDQHLDYAELPTATLATNTATTFRIVPAVGDDVKGFYYLQSVQPDGSDYSIWGGGYLNSQPETMPQKVSFIMGLNGQNGQDVKNGAVWEIKYVSGKGFTLKNIGTGKFLKDKSWALYDEPTYFSFETIDAFVAGTSIPAKIQKLLDEKVTKQSEYDKNVYDDKAKDIDVALAEFETTYEPATNNKIEMAHAPINTEFEAIKKAVAEIESITVPAESTDYTGSVDQSTTGWQTTADFPHAGASSRIANLGGINMPEQWQWAPGDLYAKTGKVLTQTLKGIPNGTYSIELYVNAVDQADGSPNAGKTDVVYVYANDKQTPVKVTNNGAATVYAIENLEITDGNLEMGLAKAKGGTNWHAIQIKSLTLLGGSDLLRPLSAQIDEQAEKLAALEAQAKECLAADKAKADLQAAVDAKKKEYADSKDADVKAAGAAQDANFDAIVTKFGEFLEAADGDVQKALKDLKLEPNNYKAKLDELTKKINDVAAAADINAQIAKVNTAVTKAQTDIVAAETGDPNADGNAFYLAKFDEKEGEIGKLFAEYKKTAADAEGALFDDKKTDADRSAAKKAGLIEQLKALQTKIEGQAKLAKDNLTSYTAQKALAEEVQDRWNEVYLQIAATDESSTRDEYLKKLDDIQVELTDAADAVEENYKKGESSAKDQTTTLNTIKKNIDNLLSEQQEGYNEQIAADNQATYEAIGEAVKKAQAAYTKATETYEEYAAAESDLLKNAIDAVKAEKDNLVDGLKEFPTKIAEKQKEIGEAYNKVTSPDVFDKDGKELKKITDLQAEVEKAENDFLDAVKAAVKADCDALVTDYKKQRDDAATIVKDFTNDKEKTKDELNKIFKQVDDLITDIETAMSAPKLNDLDQALKAAENIPEKIATIKENEADAILGPALKKAEDNKAKLSEADQTILQGVRDDYDADKKAKTLADNYATLKAKLDPLTTAVEDALAEDALQKELGSLFDEVQTAIDEAGSMADDYIGGQTVKNNELKAVQNELNTTRGNLKADTDLTTNKATYENKAKDLKQQVADAQIIPLYNAETDALENMVENDIEAQYVLFANDFETEGVQEQAAEYKKQIESLKAKIADAKKVADKDKKPADLLPLEDEVTALLTELTNANNSAAGGTTYDKLKNAADALNSDVEQDVTKFTEAEQKDIADQQAAIDKAIEDVEALIEKKKDNIVAFESSIQEKIDAIKDDIKTLQATADAAQKALEKRIADAQALAESAQKTIGEAQKAIDDTKAEIDGYEFTSSDDFKAKFDKLQKNLNDKLEAINAKVDDGTLEKKDVDGVNDLKKETETTIADVKNTAANRELLGELAALELQFAAIEVDEDEYTLGDMAEINKQLEAIENAIGDDTKGLEKDIADAKTNSKSYEGLGTDEKPGELQKKVDAIQKQIDDLNKFLEENTLNPEEPELIPGDITGSGDVDMDDVDQFIDDFMNDNLPEPGDPLFDVYDVNQDGELDIADAQAIFNLYMGLNIDGTQPNAARMLSNFKNLDMAGNVTTDVTEIGNGIKRIAVMLNANFEYTGFQVDVMGADVIDQQADGMSVRSNKMLSGTTRILGFNFSQAKAAGKVLVIDVKGDAEITDVTFTTSGARSISFNLGDATRLNGVNAGENGTTIYDLSGKVKNGLKKGVNIIRDAYGKAKKALK